MVFAEWLRPRRVLIAVVAVAAGAFACRDTTTPGEISKAGIPDPRFTLGSGFAGPVNGRGNLGTFHIKSKAAGYDVELKSHDNTDIQVSDITIAPGGHSGWHKHPGPVLVVVKTGVITFYHGSDPTCSPAHHTANTVFIEKGGDVGMARNEGTVPATAVATFFVPAGGDARIDAPQPGNCSF